MNSEITFITTENWRWLSLAFVLSAGIFCVLMEYRKRSRHQLWRSLLLGLALLSLLMVAWRPASHQLTPPKEAILLLPNAPQEVLDSLREQHPEAEIYALQEEAAAAAKWLPHISYLPEALPAGSRLYILGEGLDPQEVSFLAPFNLHYFPALPDPGLLDLTFQRSLSWSEPFLVSGSVHAGAEDTLQAILVLEGKKLDSAILFSSRNSFQLKHLPVVAGAHDFYLQLNDKKGKVIDHLPLRIKVEAEKKLTVALLSSFPSFEGRYLKNWLARQGYRVYYQAEMAPGRWQREQLNLSEKRFRGLNKELLDEVDVLILERNYLDQLSSGNQQIISTQLKKGLGLLLLTGDKNPGEQLQSLELPALHSARSEVEAPLKVKKAGEYLPPLRFSPLYGRSWYHLLEDAEGESAVLMTPQGQGIALVSSLGNTYTLLLEGKEAAYERLWTKILQQLLKPQPHSVLEADFPAFKGRRHHLELWAGEGEIPLVELINPGGKKELLPLVQDPYVPERWHAYHWPVEQGLHTLKWEGKDSLHFNVLSLSALSSWRQNKSAGQIRSYLEGKGPVKEALVKQNELHSQLNPFPLFPFYLVFLLSMGVLWLEKKLKPT